MEKGYIYIMTNPGLPNMVKIGYTNNLEERRRQLSTSLPTDFEVYATYETSVKLADKQLHSLIENLNPKLRIAKDREFFALSPEKAYQLLQAIATISDSRGKLWKANRPAINFAKCGIPVGAELVHVERPTTKSIVANERQVLYDGALCSLTDAAYDLLTYNGKLLSKIAAETQWK